jgi:hypothetical protein
MTFMGTVFNDLICRWKNSLGLVPLVCCFLSFCFFGLYPSVDLSEHAIVLAFTNIPFEGVVWRIWVAHGVFGASRRYLLFTCLFLTVVEILS